MENYKAFTELYLKIDRHAAEMKAKDKRAAEEERLTEKLKAYSRTLSSEINRIKDPSKINEYLSNQKDDLKKKLIFEKSVKSKYGIKFFRIAIEKILEELLFLNQKKIENDLKQGEQTSIVKKIDNETLKPQESIPSVDAELNGNSNPSVTFQQIDCNASRKIILAYFLILAKEKNSKGEFYMKEEDVIDLVNNMFSVFNKPGIQKYYQINLPAKKTLTYFIYCFYLKFDNKESKNKMKYVSLLINCFEQYKGENPETLISNMSESKKPTNSKNVISIEKYLLKNNSKKS